MPRETITIDLLTGNPQGLRVATFNQTWTGKAFAAPRTELRELLAKEEMNSAGVYILSGREIETNDPLAYIGIGKSVQKRLRNRKEEFWTQAMIFVGTGGTLHEGHIKFLEGRLISEARSAGRFKIINEQRSGSPLPEYETAPMEHFLGRMRILLPVLGCDILLPIAEPTQSKILTCKIKGLIAHGQRTSHGFVVFKGSQAVKEMRPAASEHGVWVINLRKMLAEKNVIAPVANRLQFLKDFEFKSPSAAAAVIRGGNANGLTEWRTEDGVTLRELDDAI